MAKKEIPAPKPFNPLDKIILGKCVAQELLNSDVHPLPPEKFIGAGVYAIYYVGNFEPYRLLAEANRDGKFGMPIYIGKADPPGSRKGIFGLNTNPGPALFNRLKDHARSVEQADNLNLTDFYCRYLTIDDIWIPLTESMLIAQFAPVWNKSLDGFGNHALGSGRVAQDKAPWDILHPGRSGAAPSEAEKQSYEKLEEKVRKHLQGLA